MGNASSALERVFKPAQGDLPPDVAKSLLGFDFSESDQARYLELSAKAQLGTMNAEEAGELDDLLTTNDVLMVLHAKARSSLREPS